MAQMERNVNLEEIDADALFGIDALKGQSLLQKLIFFGCLSAGILINVSLELFHFGDGLEAVVLVVEDVEVNLDCGAAHGVDYAQAVVGVYRIFHTD